MAAPLRLAIPRLDCVPGSGTIERREEHDEPAGGKIGAREEAAA